GRDAVVAVGAAGRAAGLVRVHRLDAVGRRVGRLGLVAALGPGVRGGDARLDDVEVAGLLVALVGLAAERGAGGGLLGVAALVVLDAGARERGLDRLEVVVLAGVEVAALGEALVLRRVLRAGRRQRAVRLGVAGLRVGVRRPAHRVGAVL